MGQSWLEKEDAKGVQERELSAEAHSSLSTLIEPMDSAIQLILPTTNAVWNLLRLCDPWGFVYGTSKESRG